MDSTIDVHLESDDIMMEDDLDDKHSFLLVSDWLATGDMPEVYFWPAGEVEECFNLFDLRGGNDFEHAVQVSGLKSKNDITVVTVSTAGKIRVKNE